MGLVFVGLIPPLQRDTPARAAAAPASPGAPLLGAVFALGWTVCLGPTLAGVLSLAAGTEGATAARGVVLIVAYCAGLGLPFLLLAFGSAGRRGALGLLRRHSRGSSRSSAGCADRCRRC